LSSVRKLLARTVQLRSEAERANLFCSFLLLFFPFLILFWTALGSSFKVGFSLQLPSGVDWFSGRTILYYYTCTSS